MSRRDAAARPIIEPFRIKTVEPIRITTPAERLKDVIAPGDFVFHEIAGLSNPSSAEWSGIGSPL